MRNNAILKDKEKPKIQVCTNAKNSESESDLEFGTTSDYYYDVVEARNSYENIGDGSSTKKETIDVSITQNKTETEPENVNKTASIDNFVSNNKFEKSSFFTNQVISDMFVSSQNSHSESIKKCAESYDLMESSFVSSKITCDGLIVTKNHLEDALDSTGSSFDSSSDEELSNGRSESDSGIGIKGTSQLSKDINNSNNSSDYEDIQVTNEINKALANNRELPDGRSDPDGSSETSPAPASIQNSQQTIDPRTSFLHSTANKPKVPLKPVISKERSLSSDSLDTKASKKSRAPEPPQNNESEIMKTFKEESFPDEEPLKTFKEFAHGKSKFSIKTNTVQLKEPRNYPAINPKFRSLNHLNKAHEAQEKLEKFEKLQSPTTPEPAPRHSLSFSTDSLAEIEKGKKKKFSIKKFLRMGNSKTEHTPKKDYSHYADIPTSPSDDPFNAPQVKPRLIIIHPLDINNTGVEVVTTPTSSSQPSTPTIAVTEKNQSVSSYKKPPMPPNRSDSTKLEMNKPTRPPPPKNNELRTKLESENVEPQKTTKTTSNDTVYANLGEIRNSIAPRKPERTNSMREREAKTLELQRRQPVGESINGNAEIDDLKDVNNKSDDDHTETYKNEDSIIAKPVLKPSSTTIVNGDGKKKMPEIENVSTRSKIELFENNALKNDTKPSINMNKSSSPSVTKQQTTFFVNSDGLKSSVQKMNMTIDSYLKNKKLSSSDSNLLDNSRSPTPPQQQIIANVSSPLPLINYNTNRNLGLRNNAASYEPINVNVSAKLNYHRSSYPDNGMCSPTLTFGNATRSYCGSEIGESEIYSPYSFCGSDAACLDVSQNDLTDGCQGSSRNKIVSRLRLRKGRSVVHTNLEDNYSAVIVANHEALAQVLDQLQQPQSIPPSLRPIANCLNLRFDDFTILDSIGLVVGKRVFHQAVWQNSIYITLVLTSDANQMVSGSELNQMSGGISGALNPITEFCDLVPNNYLPSMPTAKIQMVQATITVLPKMQVETLEMMGSIMKSKIQNNSLFGNLTGSDENVDIISINEKSPTSTASALDGTKSPSKSGLFDDLLCREVGFIVLQLVNGLKTMQAKGIEEMPMSLMNIIVCREMENKEQQARLCILQGTNSDLSRDEDEVMGTLCQCALKVIKEILPETKLTQLLSDLLVQERADTLTKIKSVLEYVLWGPSDVSINGPLRERELTLQRWLDLARATVLHGLVRTKIELTIYDECHLIFLVRSNSKIMLDASQIIATNYNNSN
ncbi:serine-rich adhesin for platelets isoform X2 [Chironomus tepperi]|uniref:serine-rich adhesin for platelets isoform X2 n=1 Tax=Chironomus tepperi TaxID=113505 RepID=UPI00391EF051